MGANAVFPRHAGKTDTCRYRAGGFWIPASRRKVRAGLRLREDPPRCRSTQLTLFDQLALLRRNLIPGFIRPITSGCKRHVISEDACGDSQHTPIGQNDSTLNDVGQLTNISRPAILDKRVEGFRSARSIRLPVRSENRATKYSRSAGCRFAMRCLPSLSPLWCW